MSSKRWTWKASEQPKILKLIEMAAYNSDWYDALEAAEGYTTGKVLSVCAALSIVREAIALSPNLDATPEDEQALNLLETWVDDPLKENFEAISKILFDQDEKTGGSENLSAPVWYALRCSISHPDGCGEIAWALGSLCKCMSELGFTDKWLQMAGLEGVRARMEINT